jgi:hypothetical protein
MRTFVKPITAAAGVGVLALSMSAAPALAAPANPNGLSPAVTVSTETNADAYFKTGASIRILEGEDAVTRPQGEWSCGLLRMDGHVASTPSKDGHYSSSWKVAVGASYAIPYLTIKVPNASSEGIGWTIPEQQPDFGDGSSDVTDLPASNTHPEYTYIDEKRVEVSNSDGHVTIDVPGGLQPGEYFNVEFDSKLTEPGAPTVGSEYRNDLTTPQNCYTPDAPQEGSDEECVDVPDSNGGSNGSNGGSTEDCVGGASDEECVDVPDSNGGSNGSNGGSTEDCVAGASDEKHPTKVNSGGENDGIGGLVALGLGAAVIGGAATYGLRRSKKS